MSCRLLGLCLVAAAAIAPAVPAQPQASYTFFGSGCQSRVVPMAVLGTPRLGGVFSLRASSPYASDIFTLTTLIFVGTSSSRWGPIQLPFNTSLVSTPGVTFCGDLLVSVDAVILVPPATGGSAVTDVPFQMPSQPTFLGFVFYQQVMEIWRLRSRGVSNRLSRGGKATIGL